MENKKTIRSPFFYVGDKYKLMPQLKQLMPKNIEQYIEPFVGGGSSFLNSKGTSYMLNDVDSYVVELHKQIGSYTGRAEELFEELFDIIDFYGLSCSYRGICVPEEMKKKYVKTYYSKYNKDAYIRMRKDFNAEKDDFLRLYLLLIYGFNHMIRFNGKGDFNLPVGNVDFNNNVYQNNDEHVKIGLGILESLKEDDINYNLNKIEIQDKTKNLELLMNRFHNVARNLLNRRENRKTLEIKDEYDVQDLLGSLLNIYFDDIRPEEWTPSNAGSANRIDFLIKECLRSQERW